MNIAIKEKIRFILSEVNKNGLKWKLGKDLKHLMVRKEHGHIPDDFSMKDYESVIMGIMNEKNSDVFVYFRTGFKKDYFVFGDKKWIVIIGDDLIMETAFFIDTEYSEYLSEKKGYKYIGKVKEVLK